jgi:predicted O-methyltransferase YrrM
MALSEVLEELADAESRRRMLNITPDTGMFLSILARATGASRILEIGTSNGYSTLWLASATNGHVDTIETSEEKIALAHANFGRAGLAERITVHHGAALNMLQRLQGPYDLVFLDADRANYLNYLPHLLRLLRVGGVLVTDNVVSHAGEVAEFLSHVRADSRLDTVTLPVGNGEELTYVRT